MDDLFEKLKSEPPINQVQKKDESEPPVKKNCINDSSISPRREMSASPRREKSVSPRREKSDSPAREMSASPKRKTSVSPPLKMDSPVQDAEISARNSPTNNDEHSNISNEHIDEKPKARKNSSEEPQISKEPEDGEPEESRKKLMPTKAQQKLFETSPVTTSAASTANKDNQVKRCRVRIKRENLVKLREKFARKRANQKLKKGKKLQKPTKKNESPTKTAIQKVGSKRKSEADDSPPTKKSKTDAKLSPPGKKNKPTGFFIKLNNNLKKLPQSPREKVPRRTNSHRAASTSVYTTKATKFTKTQLIRSFGKRYFNSRVRIERCRHPMMLTFESNARARKLQAKNKSKNLSVSFKEQVEIIGFSDSESNESDEVSGAKSKAANKIGAGATPLHLKKVENGKVVDDIEFDPKLFGEPGSNSSTPLRKKPEKKSYSPLKDDSSSTARSELLKSANEKIPSSALLRLTTEDEDEDDECEWIVPIDLPERRSSRTNSITQEEKIVEPDVIDKNTSSAEASKNDKSDKNTSSVEVFKDVSTAEKSKLSKETKTKKPVDGENLECANGNGTSEENKTHEDTMEDKDVDKLPDDVTIKDFPRLFVEHDNESPNTSIIPDKLEKSGLLTKKDDKLSEDNKQKENVENEVESVNKIVEDKASTIST